MAAKALYNSLMDDVTRVFQIKQDQAPVSIHLRNANVHVDKIKPAFRDPSMKSPNHT